MGLLCGLDPGVNDGEGTTRDLEGEATELSEEIDVLESGDLDNVDEGAVDGAVDIDDGEDKSLQLATDENDDDDPDRVGRHEAAGGMDTVEDAEESVLLACWLVV